MANAAAQNTLTMRKDAWWVEPLITVIVLGAFGVYATWRALAGNYYLAEPYLSPFFSPLITPDWWKFSPAILILWAPLGFRLTCYYYRKAYYRSFFWAPPACAVRPKAKEGSYAGETQFPFILQNIHRYFLYAATVVVVFLWYDAIKAFFFEDGFGIGIGSIVLLVNAFLLSMYSFSCHSFRHLIGGKMDVMSKCPSRHAIWRCASKQNEHHMFWAWISLFVVAFADLYVMLVARGIINDVRLI
jgi:hypothetical protein